LIRDGCRCDDDNDGDGWCDDDGGEQRLGNVFLKLLLSDVVGVDILFIFFVDLDSYDVNSVVVVSSF
jgi:hypothetical protein